MFNRYMAGAAIVALMAAAAPAVHAQQTTAAVRGIVTDQTGAPVAGATVTITHVPSGTRSVTRTDSAGRYEISGLRVGGPYRVEVAAEGFAGSRTDDINLTLADQQKLDIALDAKATTIVVTGKRTTTLSNPGSRTRLGRTAIEGTVSIKRDIREAARRDPLTQLDPNTRGTGPSGGLYIAGSAPRANRITIDGVRSNDDFGLNTGGLSTNLGPISLEAVEQMTVQAVPADVEEGDFTGGSLNLVLRSGTNAFHGSLFTYLRNKAWNGNQLYHPDTQTANKLKLYVPDENYGFFFAGPILKDRLFFATSYEKYTSASVVAAGPSGQGFGTTLLNAGVPVAQADIDAILAPWATYAASAKLTPGAIPLTTPFSDEKYSAKLDWNIMDGQRASFTYRHAFSSVWKGAPASSSALNLNTNWYTQPENEDNYALQLNSKWTDSFSTEARITMRNYQRGQTPPEGQAFSNIAICTDATNAGAVSSCTAGKLTLNFGPDQFRQANVLKTTNNSAEFVGTYRLDGHSIKAGYQGKQIHIYNLFVQAANGVYYFDSQDSFNTGKVDQLFYNNNPTGDANKAAADFTYTDHTLFVQDTFDPIANMTVNYGLRYDFWNMNDKPALNANFVARNGFSNQVTYSNLGVLQPRVGVKWHDDRFDLSGSLGLYTGGLPDVFLSNRFGNTGVLTATFTLQRQADGSFKETNSGTVFASNDPTATSLMNISKTDATFASGVPASATSLLSLNPGLVRVANTNVIAPDFKMPSDWKFNLSGHWHSNWGTVFGFDAVVVRSQEGLAFRDLRARPLVSNGQYQYTPDGRKRYDGLQVASTAAPGSSLDVNNQSIYANRVAAGLGVAANANGTPDYDLANPGSGFDIEAYNPARASWSTTVALTAQQSWDVRLLSDVDHIDLSAALTSQRTSQYGGMPEFATTDCCGGSNYGDQFALEDPNSPTKGRSSYEIRNGVKVNAFYKTEIFKGAETRITLFGDMHSGRPLSFYVADAGSAARGQVFGVVSANEMAYIPQMTAADAGNPLKFVTNGVPVYFKTAADVTNLQKIVSTFDLPTGILTKGIRRNPDVKRWDMHVSQDLNMPWLEGHKLTATLDVFNLGNLLNKKWGVVAEYGSDGRQGTPIYKVACTDATGNVVATSSPVCLGYQFSSVSTTFTTPTVNQAATLYSVMMGLKYSF